MWRRVWPAALMATCLLAASYSGEIQRWRQERDAKLRADDGWLTLAGLFWLKEGENRFGTDPANEIVLPSGPARAGVFEFRQGRTKVRLFNGPGSERELRADPPGPEDPVIIGELSLLVIRRGERYGIRLRDKNSRTRREFAGTHWFPVQRQYRVEARFVPYHPPKTISVPNVLGQVMPIPCPGYAEFNLAGRKRRLEPIVDEGELFFIFRDLTAGQETYPAGRFLYAEMPKNGRVILDFNRAENPPCAFTPYATCPLPPKQNQLATRIEAGELNSHH